MNKPARRPRGVFIGVIEIAGQFSALAQALQEAGVRTTFLDLSPDPFRYGGAPASSRVRFIRWVRRPGAFPRPVEWALAALSVPVLLTLLVEAALKHDVFMFVSGATFFRGRELPLLRLARKTVIHQFVGSDCRPIYMNGARLGPDPVDVDAVVAAARRQRRHVRRLERWSSVIVNHPPQAAFCTRPFVPSLKLGFVVSAAGRPAPPPRTSGPVRILHAPSHPASKGTPVIREGVRRLVESGVEIEYLELIGRPNAEVLAEIAASDLVLDEIYSDTPMLALTAEAAWLGRPALVAGHAAGHWDRGLAAADRPATPYCTPGEWSARLAGLVDSREERNRLGAEARAFVVDRWGPASIAERYLQLFAGPPVDWLVDPMELDYAAGAGLTLERLRTVLAAICKRGGVEALQLADKPRLEAAVAGLAGFAGRGDPCAA